MSDPLVSWHVFRHSNIYPMYRKAPCEAKVTMSFDHVKAYLVHPAQEGVRTRDAYQHIITLRFPDFCGWAIDKKAEHAAKYLRIAEVKFELTITKIVFRGKEVKV